MVINKYFKIIVFLFFLKNLYSEKIYYFKGLFTEFYCVPVEELGIETFYFKAQKKQGGVVVFNPTLPSDYENTKIVIIEDIGLKSLGFVNRLKLTKFVNQMGGGLFILAGPLCLSSKKDIYGTFFEDILPIEIEEDIPLKKSKNPEIQRAKINKITSGLSWNKKPCVYYYSKVNIKKNCDVILKVENFPLLVLSKEGKGRIAIFLGWPCGESDGKNLPYWEWDDWKKVMLGVLKWLKGGDI